MQSSKNASSVLERIVQRKKAEVQARQRQTPLLTLKRKVKPSDRSLLEALAAPELSYILECKRRSPSKGVLRDPYDVEEIASAYSPFAAAISVLTDAEDFGGSFHDLKIVSQTSSRPVLQKDFIVDPFQIYEARAAGADAVLLLLSVLNDDQVRACLEVSEALNMDALCETSSEAEMQRALDLKCPIVGINQRDLHTLTMDPSRVSTLASMVPKGTPLIAESGIHHHGDVQQFEGIVDGFLVGGALMQSGSRLDHKIRELIFGSTKICGLTRPEDAARAWQRGATHVGCVFASSSRQMHSQQAAQVYAASPAYRVGVFQNQSIEEMVETASMLNLDAVQCHGSETLQILQALRVGLPENTEIWKAVSLKTVVEFQDSPHVDALVVESGDASGVVKGGTGLDWDYAHIKSHQTTKPIWLAGGLSPQNLDSVRKLPVQGFDVCSGVEESKGKKCPEKLAEWMQRLRGFNRTTAHKKRTETPTSNRVMEES